MANKKQTLFFALCSPCYRSLAVQRNLAKPIACRKDTRRAIPSRHHILGTNTVRRCLFHIRHVRKSNSTFDRPRSSAFLNCSAYKGDLSFLSSYVSVLPFRTT